MARRRRRQDHSFHKAFRPGENSSLRDDFSISNTLDAPVLEAVRPVLQHLESFLENYPTPAAVLETEDRRFFHPAARAFRPAATPRRSPAKTYVPNLMSAHPVRAFAVPGQVAICVRRKQRKEVLHAFGKTGKGSRFNKNPRWSSHSRTRC